MSHFLRGFKRTHEIETEQENQVPSSSPVTNWPPLRAYLPYQNVNNFLQDQVSRPMFQIFNANNINSCPNMDPIDFITKEQEDSMSEMVAMRQHSPRRYHVQHRQAMTMRQQNHHHHSTNSIKNKKLFPQKLSDLINDPKYNFCLRWSDDGQLVFLDRDQFEEFYLKTPENQFHTQKAISFVRQMNMYGFRKVDDCYYENDNFKRGCPHLLKNMIRKHPNKTRATTSDRRPPFVYRNHPNSLLMRHPAAPQSTGPADLSPSSTPTPIQTPTLSLTPALTPISTQTPMNSATAPFSLQQINALWLVMLRFYLSQQNQK